MKKTVICCFWCNRPLDSKKIKISQSNCHCTISFLKTELEKMLNGDFGFKDPQIIELLKSNPKLKESSEKYALNSINKAIAQHEELFKPKER